MYINHDRLFKELLETFFEEFILLYFPSVYEHLDFKQATFLSQEVFTDVTVGETRRVDLLVKTKFKDTDSLVIIHVEPQSYVQPAFNERMFIYYSRLYEKYRLPIIPIALFTYDTKRDEADTFSVQFPFLHVLQFQFFKVELRKCSWKDYINQPNPVAAALLSKMGYNKEERVQVKLEFLRMLTRLELDPAKMKLITGFFETYLPLRQEEEEELKRHITQLEPQEEAKIMELMTSWEKKGLEKGIQQGLKEGYEKGKSEGILEGLLQGKLEGKKEVAKRLLEMGMAMEDIVKATGLAEEEIRKLK